MSETNWKSKYLDLRQKMMNSVDTAFRLGFEQGAKEAQMQAQADASAQMQAQAQQAQQMGPQGQESGEEAAVQGEEQSQEQPQGQGSELDQHINTLESMVQKSEITEADIAVLKKSADSLRQIQLNKQAKTAIGSIAKSLKPKSFNLSDNAKFNLPSQAKHAVSMQERVINDVMKSWEEEEKRASKDVLSVLASEGIIRKD